MKSTILALLLLPLLSGCFLYDCGYTLNDDTAIYKTTPSNMMPISYSLKFNTSCNSIGTPTEKSIRTKLEEVLYETGLFSEVTHGDKEDKGYHVEFAYADFNAGMGGMVYLCVYPPLLLLVPIPISISCDLSAILYLEGKPIWSVAHTEKCRHIYHIGALPAGLILNYWSVWRSIEYNIIRSTVNDLTREHIRRYLDPASVELTNPQDIGASDTQPRNGEIGGENIGARGTGPLVKEDGKSNLAR